MIRALLILSMLCLAGTAQALSPPTATSASLPEVVVEQSRNAADYAMIIQLGEWVWGPSFLTGQGKWYLQGKIVAITQDNVSKPDMPSPFRNDMTVLIIPYCSQGALSTPGGPGNGCAAFVKKKILLWGLMADTHAKRVKGDQLLIQIENPLDVAFQP